MPRSGPCRQSAHIFAKGSVLMLEILLQQQLFHSPMHECVQGAVKTIMEHARQRNPKAGIVVTDSVVTIDEPDLVRGKRVVTIDDGPTLTHGGAPFGAGALTNLSRRWDFRMLHGFCH